MLVVEGRFFFLHVPKTGGSFIQTVLQEHLETDDRGLGTHARYDDLPAAIHELPGFCVVRNPWDWYVSWFHYQSERGPNRRAEIADPGKRGVWESALRGGAADFKEAVTRACLGEFEHPLTPAMRSDGLDFYSARLREIAGPALDRPGFEAIRYERLRRQLLRFLRTRLEVSPALKSAVRRDPPVRASSHGPYQSYYDEELRLLVGAKASWICERFGYEFEA